MTAKLTLSAIALAIAAPAFAGASQLARSASVEPGVPTLAEVGEIASAETADDAARLRAFRADASDSGTRGLGRAPLSCRIAHVFMCAHNHGNFYQFTMWRT